MLKERPKVRQVRVDIPLKTTSAYLFVDPAMQEWDGWWLRFYEKLLTFLPDAPEWIKEPVQDVYVCTPVLSETQLKDLQLWFASAPENQVRTHRTLQRAVEMDVLDQSRLQVKFFSGADEQEVSR
jgi:hypothetical protein